MKFDYKSYGPGVLRPVIPIQILHRETIIFHEILIDSGADSNIFSSDIAEILGIDITMGEYAYGVAGQKGFFDKFVVKFDLVKKEVELKQRM